MPYSSLPSRNVRNSFVPPSDAISDATAVLICCLSWCYHSSLPSSRFNWIHFLNQKNEYLPWIKKYVTVWSDGTARNISRFCGCWRISTKHRLNRQLNRCWGLGTISYDDIKHLILCVIGVFPFWRTVFHRVEKVSTCESGLQFIAIWLFSFR